MLLRNIGFACIFALGIGTVVADNFEVYSGRKGCESVVKERERRDCQDLSRRKNDACNQNASCDLDKHKRQIDDYNAPRSR